MILAVYFALVIFVPWKIVAKKGTAVISYVVPALLCVLIFIFAWHFIVAFFPNSNEQQPNNPIITLVPYPNPISNAPSNTVDITITARPAPGYLSYIQPMINISNPPDSPPYCDIKLEIYLTGGFKFDETSFSLPNNMQVQAGYAHKDTMILNMQNSPSNWVYSGLKIPVYNMDKYTPEGSENGNVTVTIVGKHFSQ